ncbi:MAG: hypothetical protein ACU837_07690 [Gammaproteobacteria bacterium]
MPGFRRLALEMVQIFHLAKDVKIEWRQRNQAELLRLKHEKTLAEKNLAARLRKQQLALEHEIDLLKTKNEAELAMLKIKYRQDIKDYRQYLQALDHLKASIQSSYTHLPEAVAFTIHHHAKQLLNAMWEASDLHQRMQHEIQLIRFMSTVHEEAQAFLEGTTQEPLPKKTLQLIER